MQAAAPPSSRWKSAAALVAVAWFTTWFLELEYFLPVVGHAISAICADAHAIFNAESAFRFVVAHEDIYAESHVLL